MIIFNSIPFNSYEAYVFKVGGQWLMPRASSLA